MFELTRLETYKCQNCQEYTTLNNGNCKHCNKAVDIAFSQELARQQELELKQTLSRKNKSKMIGGLVTFSAGTTLTVLSFTSLKNEGGLAIVFWGAILFGGAAFIDGLVGWIQNKV